MAKFITIGYGDRVGYDQTEESVREAAHAQDDRLREAGFLMGVAGSPVQVRNHGGAGVKTSNESFMRADLPVAGFGVIDATDRHEAIELVSGTPCAVAHGVVEVWPLESSPSSGVAMTVEVDGAHLAVDRRGPDDGPTVLLIAGAGQSMDWWTPAFCDRLSDGELRVLRYDHRDTGQSSSSPPGEPSYSSVDLATDPVRILDALDIDRAHIVGMSMGGGIAQSVAVRSPERVRSLTLISTSPSGGDHGDLPGPTPEVAAIFDRPEPELDWGDADSVIGHRVDVERPFVGTLGLDEARVRSIAAEEVRRTRDMRSSLTNHFVAEGDASVDPAKIAAPTLVIHGTDDPLFPPAHGEALARAISGARLIPVAGIGHEIPPPPTWDVVVPALRDHVRRSERTPAEPTPRRAEGKVVWHFTMSVDGFVTGPDHDMGWMGDIVGRPGVIEEYVETTGAVLGGRSGWDAWPDASNLYGGLWHGALFVLTHHPDDVEGRTDGVTFLDCDVAEALEIAKNAAGGKNVEVLSADIGRQLLDRGLIDEIDLHIAPVLLGDGTRLYDNPGAAPIQLDNLVGNEPRAEIDVRYRPTDKQGA